MEQNLETEHQMHASALQVAEAVHFPCIREK
jgi:hypothetical protein